MGDKVAIEVKGTDLVADKHLKGIRALKEEGLIQTYVVVSLDPTERITSDGIYVLPWKNLMDFLARHITGAK